MKEKKSSKIKEELDKRGISVEDLRQFEAYGTATIFKEDLDIDEIVDWILSGRINYYQLPADKFIEEVERNYVESGSGEWFYNTYLNDLEKIVKDAKIK